MITKTSSSAPTTISADRHLNFFLPEALVVVAACAAAGPVLADTGSTAAGLETDPELGSLVAMGRSSCVSSLGMKSDRCNDCEQGGKQEDDELRELEWRFGLRRGHGVQDRYFFERLHDQHEKIKVETNHGADGINPAPRASEMFRVTREDRKREERQRYDAETDGRCETMKREKEPGDSRRDGCNEKPFRPDIAPIASEHSEHNDEAAENCGQADQRVNDGVNLQYNIRAPSVSC